MKSLIEKVKVLIVIKIDFWKWKWQWNPQSILDWIDCVFLCLHPEACTQCCYENVLGGSLLCYDMLYCPWRLLVMLCYIVLGGSLLCYVMLSLGRLLVILCYIVLRGSLLSYFMLYLEVTCYVMLYCSWRVLAMLCYVVLGGSLSWYVMLSFEAAQSEENMLIELQGWGKYWNMRVAQSFQESLDFQKKKTTVTTLCRRRAKISKQYVPLALNCNVPRTLLCLFSFTIPFLAKNTWRVFPRKQKAAHC